MADPVTPDQSLTKGAQPSSWMLLRRLLALGIQYRAQCLQVIVLQLLIVGLSLGGLGLTGLGIDYLRTVVSPGSPAPTWPFGLTPPTDWSPQLVIVAISSVVLLSALLNAVVRWAAAIASANLSQRILLQLRSDVFARLQQLSFAFYDAGQSSSIINRASGDVNAVRSFVDGVIIKVTITTITLLVYVIYMLKVHVGLTVICLATTPLIWMGSLWFSRIVQPLYRKASELSDELVRRLVENVQGAHVIKGFGREQDAINRFEAETNRIRKQKSRIFRRISVFQPLMGGLTQFNMLLLMVYGGSLVIDGKIALGAGLFVFANLLQEFANQIGQITNIANTIQTSLIGAQRVFEVLDAPLAITSPPDALPLPKARGDIAFENVTFTYPTGQRALTDVSFQIKPGECLGITGPTGCGKTTLLMLLMRFYDVDSGTIRVDGHDIRTLQLDDLRRSMGLVFQESFVFSHTIGANIAFGVPSASQDVISRAARVASAEEFIQKLPDKYDTMVGEYGSTLSGGQRQRLAIARAVLLDPGILLLDDATASVDAETEHEISTALEQVSEGRTSLVISNRLSTLRRANRVLVMNAGQVVAIGSPDELMHDNEWFQHLSSLQESEQLFVA